MRITRVIALLVVAILAVSLPASALAQPNASAAKAKKHKSHKKSSSSCRKKAKKSGVDKKRTKHKSSCKKKKKKKATTPMPPPTGTDPGTPTPTPTPTPAPSGGAASSGGSTSSSSSGGDTTNPPSGGGENNPPPPPPPPPPDFCSSTYADAQVTPATNPGDAEASVDCLINQARVANGLPPYTLTSAALLQSSTFHANDSVANKFWIMGDSPSSHVDGTTTPGPPYTQQQANDAINGRIRTMAGYCAGGHSFADAEDTYAGSGTFATPRQAVTFWLNDPPHRATLLSTTYTEHRIAVVVGNPFQGGTDASWGTFVEDLGLCVP